MNIRQIFGFAAVATMLVASGTAEAARLPKGASNMKPVEVRAIYNGKTWVWDAGGGYFATSKKFQAVAGKGKSLTTATGRWLVTRGGRLCFIADWTDRKKTYRNTKTCFNHAAYRGRIYQSKDLSGNWYVFKSNPTKASDAIKKVKPGNRIKSRFAKANLKLKKT